MVAALVIGGLGAGPGSGGARLSVKRPNEHAACFVRTDLSTFKRKNGSAMNSPTTSTTQPQMDLEATRGNRAAPRIRVDHRHDDDRIRSPLPQSAQL
jgi:hypothetical protein